MSVLRPGDDTQPIPVVRGRHAAPRHGRFLAGRRIALARELGIIAAIGLVAVIVLRTAVGQIVYVADDAMLPTLAPGDRVFVTPWGAPAPGDVVLVDSPAAWKSTESTAFARVMAVPGQRIACCDAAGRITVDGVRLTEGYLAGETDQVPFDVVIPEGRIFVLVDDRSAARDSRVLLDSASGTLSLDEVHGRALAVMWPPRVLGD